MESIISPYSSGYGLQFDDGDVILQRNEVIYVESDNDVIHTVKEDETIQSIATKYYGDSGKWDIIADANVIYNPIDELKVNMQIVIPNGRHT